MGNLTMIRGHQRLKTIFVILVALGMLGLMGFWVYLRRVPQRDSVLSPPILLSQQLIVLDEIGFTQLKEIGRLTAPPASGPVVTLALPTGSKELLAASQIQD
jgi:hypothetical protein